MKNETKVLFADNACHYETNFVSLIVYIVRTASSLHILNQVRSIHEIENVMFKSLLQEPFIKTPCLFTVSLEDKVNKIVCFYFLNL